MINFSKIVKEFESGKRVLDELDLEIPSHKFTVLVGPSGSGKSTLLRLLSGLESPTSGKIYIDGKDVSKVEPKDRNVGMVFQNYALYPHFTVEENLSYPLKLKSIPKEQIKQRVHKTAKMLEMQDLLKRYPKGLSGGQKQRVAIGRCIIRKPAIFLFDEPLSNLDARLRENLRREIIKLHQQLGHTSIYVTHDQTEAMALGELIVVLNEGKIQQMGTPKEIYQQPKNIFTAQFIGSPTINKMRGRGENGKFQVDEANFALPISKQLASNSSLSYACIRPDNFKILSTQDGIIKAKLMFVEYLGAKSLLEFKSGAISFLVETKIFDWQMGQDYSLDVDKDDILWFDDKGDSLTN
ncbi:MAG: ABC transporter ATP-binding protein [SAR324 cluster bacterium]|nr:ABC transporter ATP-binding protein [SAR324 cluster bacterium]